MPNYMLILRSEKRPQDITHPADAFDQMVAWANDLHQRKILRGVNPLVTASAKTLRQKSGAFVVDGPHAEGKEAILGYFVFAADDQAKALEIAKGCPCLRWSGEWCEVVEVGNFPQLGS